MNRQVEAGIITSGDCQKLYIKHQPELPISTIDWEAADPAVLSNAVTAANTRGAWNMSGKTLPNGWWSSGDI